MKNSTKLIGVGVVATIIALLYFKSKKTNSTLTSKSTTTSNNGSSTTNGVVPPKGSNITPKPIDVVPTNNNSQLAEQARLARLAEIARLAKLDEIALQARLAELDRLQKLAQSALAEKDRLEKARLLMLEQENLSLEQARLLVIKQAIEDAKIIAIQNSIISNPISSGGSGAGSIRGIDNVLGAIPRQKYII